MANILHVERTDNKITLGTTGTTINIASHTASKLLSLNASKNLSSDSSLLIPTFAGLTISGTSTPNILLQSTDASNPTFTFKTTNTAHQMDVYLDEDAANVALTFAGQTTNQDTQLVIQAIDGKNSTIYLYSGDTNLSYISHSYEDRLEIGNNVQDKDIYFGINDGGVYKSIIWDADIDKLKHSAGLFDFDDDNIETSGTLTCGVITQSGTTLANTYQPLDTSLTSIAGLTYTSDSFIKVTAEDTYAIRTIAETKTDLSLNLVENTAHSTDAHTMTIDGRDVSVDGTKLDGIEALADVTSTHETSHATVLVDGDFGSAGLMYTDGAGAYSIKAIGTDVQAYHANLAAIVAGTWVGAASITTLGTIATVGNITIADGGTIGQAAGPLITFDNTLDFLEITGCKVGIGTATPSTDLDVSGSVFAAYNIGDQFFCGTTSANATYKNVFRDDASNDFNRLMLLDMSGDVGAGNVGSALTFKRSSTVNMVDGFGPGMLYAIEDDAEVENFIARTAGRRDGADNTGKFQIDVASTGTLGTVATFYADGSVEISGALMAGLKTGTTQVGAGAAAGELWVDTDDANRIKMGV